MTAQFGEREAEMKIGGMIFDLDGTLTDTLQVALETFREALRVFTGQIYTDEEIVARFGPTEEGMLQQLLPTRWKDCLSLYLRIYEREHRRTGRLFPGIETALDMLKDRGIPLAVVTGKGAHSAAISLTQLGLTSYFDIIETGSPEGNIKARCIKSVLARWRVPPGQTAYLGDAVSDIEVARTTGLIPLAAAWDERADPDTLRRLGPAALFRTVEEFIGWIPTVEPVAERSPRSTPGTPPRDCPVQGDAHR